MVYLGQNYKEYNRPKIQEQNGRKRKNIEHTLKEGIYLQLHKSIRIRIETTVVSRLASQRIRT